MIILGFSRCKNKQKSKTNRSLDKKYFKLPDLFILDLLRRIPKLQYLLLYYGGACGRRLKDIKKEMHYLCISFEWWALRDSNPRPSACKADALNQLS